MQTVIDLHVKVPVAKGHQTEPLSPELEVQLGRELAAIRAWQSFPTAGKWEAIEAIRKATNKLWRAEKTKSFRKWVAFSTKRQGSLYKAAKRAREWNTPRESGHMPDLIVDGAIFQEPAEKSRCLSEAIWTDVGQEGETPPPLSPPQSPAELPLVSGYDAQALQGLHPGELASTFKRLRSRRSGLPDRVANEAFKLSAPSSLPYVEHLFEACLNLCYHPRAFRDTLTVMLRKPGKESCDQPKSWRPVALSSCLGKMLEKIVANRLKGVATELRILPDTQFAAPGRCTTHAVQHLLNIVYRAWSPTTAADKRFATVLSLDMGGAYDGIPRDLLISRLAEKRIHYWIRKFIWSFLSDRRTNLLLPGYKSDRFWVNSGIPQGSPLSPILFLIFAAGLLETVAAQPAYRDLESEHFGLGYVDDHYLVVTSPSYKNNCKALEKLYGVVLDWGKANGVVFDPKKTKVLHFRPPRGQKPAHNLLPKIEGLAVSNNSMEPKDSTPPPKAKKKGKWKGPGYREKLGTRTDIRLLGVQLDPTLRWGPHLHEVSCALSLPEKLLC